MADTELKTLLEPHKSTLGEMAKALASADHTKFVTYTAALVTAIATANPHIALLAPLAEKGIAKAFSNSADAMLRRELAALEQEEKQRAFLAQIDDVVATLVGQAIVQLARVQLHAKDEVLDALGGMREDLAWFRERFEAEMGGATVRLDIQMVRNGGTGIRVGADTRKCVFIARQDVDGEGSVGIDLR